ncbi:dipeptide epimerase [Pseudolysobacter antarcticus]|uniref:Dipeptide epimerase n=1 Tax=Pseudolysobacter antarcticus TaxID=2511995 RepID=A0A411HK24_9GAMM|nr:dipeptide epimerase [Pseudolysobacter antarcticus]QBB70754.1 dipeptide epimerase [Pseudolysobacter antarcticus]
MSPQSSPRLTMKVRNEPLEFTSPFRISGYVFKAMPATVVTLSDGEFEGRGEAAGVYYLDDNPDSMLATIEGLRATIESGLSRDSLRELLPPGGARNALDCALWELESRRASEPVWKLAGVSLPHSLLTTFTVGADEPDVMAHGARAWAQARAIKLKLTGELALDIARVQAVRAARPDVWLAVDANQGYSRDGFAPLMIALRNAGVSLLEQPCRRGCEAELDGIEHLIPIAADESALSLGEIDALPGRFDVVNIKLDKCGGLTEGLLIAAKARELGLQVMVGNMAGSSWAAAPAFVLGQLCDIVDLDGPLFLKQDRIPGVQYSDGRVDCPEAVWGAAQAAVQSE